MEEKDELKMRRAAHRSVEVVVGKWLWEPSEKSLSFPQLSGVSCAYSPLQRHAGTARTRGWRVKENPACLR